MKLFACICLVELEVCRALEQVAHTFVVFHTGELEKDLTILALKHLDVGRNHTELVDTVAEHVGGRVVYTVFDLCLEGRTHGVVACTAGYDILKYHREVGLRFGLTVELDKAAYEVVALVRSHHLVGTLDSGLECRVGVTGFHRAEHVGHVYLKDNVHTALEVEAEAYTPFAYIIECVKTGIHFLFAERVHVVLVGLVVGSVIIVA